VRAPLAEIVASGDELTLGRIANTNAAWLSRRLADLGFQVSRHTTLPDVLREYASEIRAAARRADLVILSGGLGPTVDDLTREAAARALGVPLVRDRRALAQIRRFFARRARTMPPTNERQADLPRGAALLPNPVGTAPGFAARAGRSLVAALPGVPGELFAMFDGPLRRLLEKRFPRRPAVATRELELIGLPESEVGRRLEGIASPQGNPRLSLMVRDAVVCVRLVARGRTKAEARRALGAVVKGVRAEFGDRVFGEGGQDPADVVAALLMRSKVTLALAESCTGGLVGHLLTNVAGVSRVLLEGLVTYSNASKARRLGVRRSTLARHGAVSRACAAEMAAGAARTARAAAALAITGVAGPGGGTRAKPVGLVFTAVRLRGRTTVEEHRIPGDRVAVKSRAARLALDHLRRRLLRIGS
jgi:nicotinamide-nucleotide amidase